MSDRAPPSIAVPGPREDPFGEQFQVGVPLVRAEVLALIGRFSDVGELLDPVEQSALKKLDAALGGFPEPKG